MLPKYISNGQNWLCYAYILGKCQGKMCGKSSEGHAPAGDIMDSFAHELCSLLEAGIKKRLVIPPPPPHTHTTKYQFLGGYSSKWFKGTVCRMPISWDCQCCYWKGDDHGIATIRVLT